MPAGSGPESANVTVSPDTEMEETAGAVPPVVREKPPGPAVPLVTGSDILTVMLLDVTASTDRTVGAMPSTTVTVALSSWLVPSVIPPVLGLAYMSVRSGLVSGRSPESVRVMEFELPAGFVLAETVREPASVPLSDQCEPSVASASTFSLNVTVIEFSDAATASLMEGGVVSVVWSVTLISSRRQLLPFEKTSVTDAVTLTI